jgi:glycosyltransferase involved in cell wall biosynthesis
MRVLFYDDAPEFGGHEILTLAAVRHIASQPNAEVGFMFFRGNLRLSRLLGDMAAQCPGLTPLPQDYASRQFQFLRTLLSLRAIGRIAKAMQHFRPDIVVVAQGAIAFGSAGLMAAKKARLPTVSYIPMTHPERMFSASRLRAAVREPVNRLYYRLPDEYITISPRMEGYLRSHGMRQRVTIVKVAIDLANCHPVDKAAARAKLGLAADDWVAALVGRVQFWQKRQDLAIEALALARQQLPKLKLLLVGDGPDLAALKARVAAAGLEQAVVFAGWTDGLSPVYAAIDALVIPSRYEGVPLVMIEAMHFRRPVIASAVDGMVDTLPPHWLFPSGDAAALAARLVEAAQHTDAALLHAHSAAVSEGYSLPAFQRDFLAALTAAVHRLGRGHSATASSR